MEFNILPKLEWKALKKKHSNKGRKKYTKRKEKKIHIKRIYERQVFINTESILGPFSRLENKVC